MIKGLKFLRDSNWPEIFETWRLGEGLNPAWIKLAQEKGWPDWESWRQHSASFIQADQRPWKIFTIENPTEFIPKMIVGPYKGWQNNFIEDTHYHLHTFQELVEKAKDWCINNAGVLGIMKNFPQETQFIGLYLKDQDRVICFEGTHRSTAVTLAKALNHPIDFTGNPTIAITELTNDEINKIQEMITQGTQRP